MARADTCTDPSRALIWRASVGSAGPPYHELAAIAVGVGTSWCGRVRADRCTCRTCTGRRRAGFRSRRAEPHRRPPEFALVGVLPFGIETSSRPSSPCAGLATHRAAAALVLVCAARASTAPRFGWFVPGIPVRRFRGPAGYPCRARHRYHGRKCPRRAAGAAVRRALGPDRRPAGNIIGGRPERARPDPAQPLATPTTPAPRPRSCGTGVGRRRRPDRRRVPTARKARRSPSPRRGRLRCGRDPGAAYGEAVPRWGRRGCGRAGGVAVPVREVGLAVRQPRRPRRLCCRAESAAGAVTRGHRRVGEASRVGGRRALPCGGAVPCGEAGPSEERRDRKLRQSLAAREDRLQVRHGGGCRRHSAAQHPRDLGVERRCPGLPAGRHDRVGLGQELVHRPGRHRHHAGQRRRPQGERDVLARRDIDTWPAGRPGTGEPPSGASTARSASRRTTQRPRSSAGCGGRAPTTTTTASGSLSTQDSAVPEGAPATADRRP